VDYLNKQRMAHETIWIRCLHVFLAKILTLRLDASFIVGPVLNRLARGNTYNTSGGWTVPNMCLFETTMLLTDLVIDRHICDDAAATAKDLIAFQHCYLREKFCTAIKTQHYMTSAELEAWYTSMHGRIGSISVW
jgi:hypothetical protein